MRRSEGDACHPFSGAARCPARDGVKTTADGEGDGALRRPARDGVKGAADGSPLTGEAPVGSLRSRTCDNSATVSG